MKQSIFLSFLLAFVLVLWMASGHLAEQDLERQSARKAPMAPAEQPLMKVEISPPVELDRRERTLTLQGQLEPLRDLVIRAEIAGTIEDILVDKGQKVKHGDLLFQMQLDGRDKDLAEAQAALETARTENSAARKLAKQGLQSQVKNQQTLAALASAKAALARIQRDIEDLKVGAPFDGIINDLPIEIGQQLDRGAPMAQLVDDSKLIVAATVAQQSVHKLSVGQRAQVRLIDDTLLDGEVTFLSAIADNLTHSYRVEVTVANDGHGSIAGSSASVTLPVDSFEGFFITPAMLSLDKDGEIGLKSVDENNVVVFHPITMEQTFSHGAWVSGIPAGVRVITLGQGFVTAGQPVDAIETAVE